MYTSMTGFSSTGLNAKWGTLTLDIASVNHRYQEIYVRLPKELQSREPWFHRKLREAFRRGKVQARVEIAWAADECGGALNVEVLRRYCSELSELTGGRQVAVESLLLLPGVLDVQGRARLSGSQEIEPLLDELLSAGIASWNAMRVQEGAHLAEAIASDLSDIESTIGVIGEMYKPSRDAAFSAMVERVGKVLEALGVDPAGDQRFIQEAVILADKWDISEELARMTSHIGKFRNVGADKSRDSTGRKLDFLVQEMNREINTIDSKIADAEIRWLAVGVKSALERIREQIQNLE